MNSEFKNENGNQGEHHNDNHVTLTVANIEGSYTHKFNKHQTLKHVLDFTVEKLELLIDLNQYELVMNNGTVPLPLNNTIEQANIVDGAILQLRKKNAGGGDRA